jgi:hypothetical protein
MKRPGWLMCSVAGRAVLALLSALSVWTVPAIAHGQSSSDPPTIPGSAPEETSDDPHALAREAIRAFVAGKFTTSEDLLLKQLKLQPNNFVVYYNLACCRAMRWDKPKALEYLTKAIEHGFCDARTLRSDASLKRLHDEDLFKEILAKWPQVLEARRDANLKGVSEDFKSGYVDSLDERLKLAYRSAFDEKTFAAAKVELAQLADWADANAIPDILKKEAMSEDAWVVVVLPSSFDFARWMISAYGPITSGAVSMVAGSYEHDAKRLVAMDLGATLRHEFFHVLHWRDMTRRGQVHPIWIMEGLCSLVEDYDRGEDGKLVPAPSWRTNTVKRLEKLGKLPPIEQLAAMPQQRFTGSRPLANYALSRAVFLYLWQEGKLKEWYQTYTDEEMYKQDPTGVKALEEVFGKNIDTVNREYRNWVRELPMVPEEIKPGMASLGVEIQSAEGEGLKVIGVNRRDPRRGDLRPGDIVVSVDHRSTRDIAELVRVLSKYTPDTEVEVDYRRGRLYKTTKVTLVTKR